MCGHILASFQVGGGHEASPQAAFQVITQFAESYFKMEESLALSEKELDKVYTDEAELSVEHTVMRLLFTA